MSADSSATPELGISKTSARGLTIWALRSEWRRLLGTTVLLSCHQIGEAMVPVIIGAAISRSIAAASLSQLWLWLIVLAVDFAFLSFSYRFGGRLAVATEERLAHRIRMAVAARVLAPAGGVDEPPGELVARSTSDAGRVAALVPVVGSTVAAVGVLVICTVLLLQYSLLLGAIIIGGTALLVGVIAALAGKFGALSHQEQQASAQAAVLVEDYLRGIRVLAGIGARRTAAHHAVAAQRALAAGVRTASGQGLRTGLTVLFTGLYLSLIAGVGGVLALNGELNLGSLVASLGLAQFLIGPLQVLAGSVSDWGRAQASAARVQTLLQQAPAVADRAVAPAEGKISGSAAESVVSKAPSRGDIRLDNVVIGGWGTLDLVLRDGLMTGIAVADAQAAATVCKLLARELDPASGEITVGEIPFGAKSLGDLRSLILVAPHESRLFHGSVSDNVEWGSGGLRSEADESNQNADSAMRAAMADEVVETLSGGVLSEVGTEGVRLSGGQRQRISLARALAADSPVLVLHDPTTAVDAATENVIADRLRAFRAGRTTIIVSPSSALLRRCDEVLFLTPDHVLAGHHDELQATSPDYQDLVRR